VDARQSREFGVGDPGAPDGDSEPDGCGSPDWLDSPGDGDGEPDSVGDGWSGDGEPLLGDGDPELGEGDPLGGGDPLLGGGDPVGGTGGGGDVCGACWKIRIAIRTASAASNIISSQEARMLSQPARSFRPGQGSGHSRATPGRVWSIQCSR
jgi:hypothetical protein